MKKFAASLFGTSKEAVDLKRREEVSQILPLADCSHDCESCTTKYPTSVKIELDADIYNSTKPTACHFVVPTGKTDWPHDATSVPKTVENAIASWIDSSASKFFPTDDASVKVSTSSFPTDLLDIKCQDGECNDILILPFFVWVRKVDYHNVNSLLDELVPTLIKSHESGTPPPSEIQSYKVELDKQRSYIFLCSHTTRDKRCGVTAPLMKREMDSRLRETGHYRDVGDDTPDGVNVAFINHVGGHKFAANVIIYIKTGEIIWLAKCTPAMAQPIIDETVLGGGKVWVDLIRRIQKGKAVEW
ncbi:Actin patches distal protein 1 [Cyberlindnera fabianii]|uniref:Actin patches distal protein 1 n=1 Tax=Cyberlindnera fabianii TaxID=36022 RepID=A0A1V2L014_CYBFA|nr:Actin patches distal protein 1 [Cyberlindnera fabianii]